MTLGGHVQLEQAVPFPVSSSSSVIRASVVPVFILLASNLSVKVTKIRHRLYFYLPPHFTSSCTGTKTRFICNLL